MAEIFEVPGPTAIYVCTSPSDHVGGGTYDLLGYTPNEDLVRFSVDHAIRELTSTHYGETPREAIKLGSWATIPLVLIKWDTTIIKNIRTRLITGTAGTSNPGRQTVANIGTLMIGTGSSPASAIGVRIQPLIASRTIYTFPCCWLMPDGIETGGFGNDAIVQRMAFRAVPNLTDGDIWKETTSV